MKVRKYLRELFLQTNKIPRTTRNQKLVLSFICYLILIKIPELRTAEYSEYYNRLVLSRNMFATNYKTVLLFLTSPFNLFEVVDRQTSFSNFLVRSVISLVFLITVFILINIAQENSSSGLGIISSENRVLLFILGFSPFVC
jgi:hypothetical protein